LLSSWIRNPLRYADTIVNFLLKDLKRLNFGYGMWGTGNGTAAIARSAISAASPNCSQPAFRQLESAIMSFYPPTERTETRRLGYTQLLLLDAMDRKRLKPEANERLDQLSRKFPNVDFSLPTPGGRGAFEVTSPIPERAADKMSDENWISAMQKYREHDGPPTTRGFGVGGSMELSRQLELRARLSKPRFAALALKLPADIPPLYFDALVRALTAKKDDSQPGSPRELPPLEQALLLPVFRQIHNLPGNPCGRWLCSAISEVADKDLPDDVLEIVTFYAIHGGDPENSGTKEQGYFGGDLVNYGINTTRGSAADALADLLIANAQRWPKLEQAIRSVVNDQSWSVRAVAISCLTALLNVDRSLATKLFLQIAAQSRPVLSSMFVERFLYYAVFSHYAELREVLLAMLSEDDAGARTASAFAISVASFRVSAANHDIPSVLSGDEVCRTALANVAAGNLQFQEASDKCRQWLELCFRDDSKKVREAASRCFREVSDEQLSEERGLIDVFIDSPAFPENAYSLLLALEKSVHRLPDVVCRIPEKAAAIYRNSSPQEQVQAGWWTHQMATLVLRLYDQTRDAQIKSRCLDVLDAMIELDFGDVTAELVKLDRA